MLEVDPIQSEPEPVEGDPVPYPEDEEFFVRPDAGDMEEAIDKYWYIPAYTLIYMVSNTGHCGCCSAVPLLH